MKSLDKPYYRINDRVDRHILTARLCFSFYTGSAINISLAMLPQGNGKACQAAAALGNIHAEATAPEDKYQCQYDCLDFQNLLQR